MIETAPAGITPLELGSVGELRSFLRRSATDGALLTDRSESRVRPDGTVESTVIDTRFLHYSYVRNPVWRTRFNPWADVYVAAAGSFHWIDDVRGVRAGLAGSHPFMRLVDKYTVPASIPAGRERGLQEAARWSTTCPFREFSPTMQSLHTSSSAARC